ncbi:MAG: polysaccharide deacetylase family protein [Ruminococcus sp.]|nr:polysaccharide deacetylase family protein [Ruminococcus sp.]
MYKCLRAKHILQCLLAAAVILWLCPAIKNCLASDSGTLVPLPVIMYHSVCNKQPTDYIVTPRQLDNDLAWLKSRGFVSVSAEQLIRYTKGSGELPQKPVLITFDDGFYNNLSAALPLLEKYDMRAVISIVGRYTDDYAPADPHSESYSYLTWEDISELAASGRIEIGSHTYDMHSRSGGRQGCAKLPDESDEEYAFTFGSDIGLLRTELHQNCGIIPAVFAFPFGALCKESLPVLRDSGILMTLTCREGMNFITRGPDCLYGIFRYNRSGLLSTDEYMERITKNLPESP